MNLTITILVLSAIVVPVWYAALHPEHFGFWVLLGVIVASAVGWGMARLTRPMKTKFKLDMTKCAILPGEFALPAQVLERAVVFRLDSQTQ